MTYEEALNRALAIERGGSDKGRYSRDSRKRSCLDIAHGGHQGRGSDGPRLRRELGPLSTFDGVCL